MTDLPPALRRAVEDLADALAGHPLSETERRRWTTDTIPNQPAPEPPADP